MQLRDAGWIAELYRPEPASYRSGLSPWRIAAADVPAIVSGPGPGGLTRTLRAGHRAARDLMHEPIDLIVAPLSGGIAQPLLMARATGEGFACTGVALWADAPAAVRLLSDDAAVVDPGPLVDDALERTALRLADHILVSGDVASRGLDDAASQAPRQLVRLPGLQPYGKTAQPPAAIREIAFIGPGSRRSGLPMFLDAIEALGLAGRPGIEQVSFVGPMRDEAEGWSKALLGIRAQGWTFPFKLEQAATVADAWHHLQRPGILPVFAGVAADDDTLFAAVLASGRPMLAADTHPLAYLLDERSLVPASAAGLCASLDRALSRPAVRDRAGPADGWAAVLGSLPERAVPTRRWAPKVSVCITHRDRPALLRRAVTSVAAGGIEDAEIVIVDNASTDAAQALEELAHRPDVRLIQLPAPVPQAAACNRAAAAATGDVIVFLDDDNSIAPNGLARFARAFDDAFDVVVTALDLCNGSADTPASARLIFLGDAGSAGLFFNGFGDTGMAFRREEFLRLGGFLEDPYATPALDWILLARARAAGLRIAALQQPAIRYARNPYDEDRKWRKRDQEGARGAVLAAYGEAFDRLLVAKVAQGAMLMLL